MSCQVLSALEVSLFSSQLAGLSRPLNGSISAAEHAGGRKRGKVAELLRKVKNLFLESDRLARGQTRELHPAFCDLELAAECSLARPLGFAAVYGFNVVTSRLFTGGSDDPLDDEEAGVLDGGYFSRRVRRSRSTLV